MRLQPATPPTPDPGVSGAADKYLPLCRACASWGEFVDWCDADANDRQPRPCSRCGRATWFEFRAERAANAAPPPVQPPGDGEEYRETLARQFHEAYERLAPSYGYQTRAETREVPWARLPAANKELMVHVVDVVAITAVSQARAEALREVLNEARSRTLLAGTIFLEWPERLASAVPGTPGEAKK